MARAKGTETILLDLDTHDAIKLVLEPTFEYENILQRTASPYKIEVGKNKLKMLHLNKPKNNLQPKTSCDNWNPTISFGTRAWEIEACEFEVNGEQCPDQFDADCLKNLKLATNEIQRLRQSGNLLGVKSEIDPLNTAMTMQIRSGLVDDVYKVGWFGDIDFGAKVSEGEIDLSHISPKEREKLIRMLSVCGGWWSEAMARVHETSEMGKVRYLDTNDGTSVGNATNPANIKDYLKQMRISSHPILQFWNMGRPRSEWPAYWLQKGLFDALITAYENDGTEAAHRLIIDGITIPNATTFNGYPVFMVPEWTMFDYELGRINPMTGYSKIQRSMFSAQQNLCGVANMTTLEGQPSSSLVIEADPSIRAKGKKYIYGAYSFGFGLAQPVLMTVGYNSSKTFI